MGLSQDQVDIINAMKAEMEAAPAIYRPSKYWQHLNDKNTEELRRDGPENFKRTVNQNYFNWIPLHVEDNQIKRLEAFFRANPSEAPFAVDYKGSRQIEASLMVKGLSERKALWELYARFVGLLWYYSEKTDRYGVLAGMSEPEVGNPIRITLGGKCVSQDLANSIRERNVVMDHVGDKKVVAELGAGYGRLAYAFGATARCRYLIFDIPPALYLSQWYLGTLFPERKHVTFRHFEKFEDVATEVEACDFGFFTPNQLDIFPLEYMDAFISISSLQEMRQEQVQHYLGLMSQKTRGIMYLKQWIEWINDRDLIRMEKDDYRIRDWELVLDRTESVQDKFFEMVFAAPRWAAPGVEGAAGAGRSTFLGMLRDWLRLGRS